MKINKLFLVLCIGLLAFASCKKEDPKPQDNNNKVALAMRSSSGDIVSLVDCEEVMEQMRKDNATKDLTENYIVESVQVIDKTDDKPFCFVISLLDVENETTIRLSYIGDFVEEEDNIIYAAEEFAKGNYKIIEPYGEEYDPEAEGDESPERLISRGRCLFEADDDYYTAPYCIVHDEKYDELAPWSNARNRYERTYGSGKS